MGIKSSVHTKVLTNDSVTLLESDHVSQVTLKAASGVCTLTGNMPFRGESSQPISLAEGTPFTVSAYPGASLEGLVITTAGTVNIVFQF